MFGCVVYRRLCRSPRACGRAAAAPAGCAASSTPAAPTTSAAAAAGPQAEPDTTGPVLSAAFSADFFSPDGDGENDVMYITLNAEDDGGIYSWMIRIYEPNSTDHLFYEMSGIGAPPARLSWDGRSNITGELVQSASDYDCSFSATDNAGNVSTIHGVIQVDILVIREGDRLRVQVPSIVFGSNSGGFDGLAEDVVENNMYILTRIAAVLNKFRTYKVQVEGHTNPLAQTEREKQREQVTDQLLSTQRAQTVVNYLVDLGVDSSRLSAIGVGGARTIVPYADEQGRPNRDNWWKNRRVEFLLIK
jgi:outer membrane protein OmpA-like peptidoglycan-associated protein